MKKQIRKQGKIQVRLIALILIALAVLATTSSCAKKVHKIGVLSGLSYFHNIYDGFKEKMTELGYVEGQNVVYDVQKMDIDMAAYKSTLNKFVASKVDLIFVFPTEAAMEAKQAVAGTKIPVVFANSLVEGNSLIKSLQEPGDNITGVRFPAVELTMKRYELLRQIAPKAKRIWITYLDGYPIVPIAMDALRPTAQKDGLTLVEVPAKSPQDIQNDLAKRSASKDPGVDAILIIPEPITLTPGVFTIIAKFAAPKNIPSFGVALTEGDYGAILGVLPNIINTGKQAATLADKILKGGQAGTIPVLTPEMELTVNYKAAQKMKISVPEGVLGQAVEIIK